MTNFDKKSQIVETLGIKLRNLRKSQELTLRELESITGIDISVLSKIERGIRIASVAQIQVLAKCFNGDEDELMLLLKAEKVLKQTGYGEKASEVLQVAEEQITFGKTKTFDFSEYKYRIVQIFKEFPLLRKVWLFGSVARGEKFVNDIDLAIKADTEFSYFDLAELKNKLEMVVNVSVDIGFIDSLKRDVKKMVMKDIKLIYEKK